ncbi:UNVERIFIED_CONTAM: hypothetical protein Sindi_1771100 [Sesamum indicum]
MDVKIVFLHEEESAFLTAPFTGEDVKHAVFGIAEDKALEPDGYSSVFYKAAWPVVAEEVTKAVLEFFTTGRILKQINSKILLFGFLDMFNKWIEECVTTPSFSIGMNGKPHGFFPGARGLRQGNPLSPYLFVLVMEVLHMGFMKLIQQDMNFTFHWKCEASRIFQLGFADDLLLICRANTESIRILKDGLDRVALWSKFRLNAEKSHLIISKSAQNVKEQLLAVLRFQEGHLPMRYLGLPLISSRLSTSDCQPLLTKIDVRINGWEGLTLSYAGRLQIIKSVLISLSVYWASVFLLSKGVIRVIEKRLWTFLWKGTDNSGYPKVAWKEIYKLKEEGGLGIQDIVSWVLTRHFHLDCPGSPETMEVERVIAVADLDKIRGELSSWRWEELLSMEGSVAPPRSPYP